MDKEKLAEPQISGYEGETVGQRELRVKELRVKELRKIIELNKSGYAGMNPNGNIVDRRLFPDAIPVQENSLSVLLNLKNFLKNEKSIYRSRY